MAAPRVQSAGGTGVVRRALLLATVFLTGAAVLVVEVVGARVLAPSYGSGLYSWSALISVTLAALALGYAMGGRLADRFPEGRLLATLVFLSGVLVLLVPWLARPVLELTADLEPRLGVLTAALLLFLPPLCLLGTVSPVAIRLARPLEAELGSVSGLLFAVSTTGSLLAALATGFVLIPNVGVRAILSTTGAVLAVVAAAGFAGLRRPKGALAALLAAGAGLSLAGAAGPATADRLSVVYREPSFYGLVRVVDSEDLRVLTVDGIGQNYVIKGTGLGEGGGYAAFLGALPRITPSRPGGVGGRSARGAPNHPRARALLVGLGAGDILRRLTAAGVEVDVVEIDPRIAEAARELFGVDLPPGRLHLVDGRLHLRRTRERYDYILLDAFVAEDPPAHLLTKEAFEEARARLLPGGILGVNYTAPSSGEDVAAVAATLRSVLPYVKTLVDESGSELASNVYLASTAPIVLDPGALTDGERARLHPYFVGELPPRPALVLTDDYCPLASLRRGISAKWRRGMVEFFGGDRAFWSDF